jgi:signal transduction histidine kinase
MGQAVALENETRTLAEPRARRKIERSVSLSQRLALLAAIIAVTLILGTTELTLSWSAGSRLEDLRRESEALAETWAVYLNRNAPTGDSAAVAQALASWPSQHITATAAVVFAVRRGNWVRVAGTDPTLAAASADDRRAAVERTMTVWREGEPRPAWRVSMPLGRGAPWGVLSVAVSTQLLEVQARSDRRRTYQIAFATAVVLGLAIWWLTRSWVGRPLAALEEAMDRTQARGPEASASVLPAGPAEFRRLAVRYAELERSLGLRERESEARGELLAMEERARGLELVLMAEQAGAEFAHEIGTPLNTVRGHLQLLHEDLVRGGDPAGAERVDAILTQVNRVSGIVRAKLGRGSMPLVEPERTELVGLAERMLRFLEPIPGDGQPVHAVEIAPGVESGLYAWCDPDLVEQIVLNLLKNSIEATPGGGVIWIGGGRDSNRVRLELADDGAGLPEEARLHLFEPFATTKRASGGTGLGLTISRRLARAMGGDLEHVPTERGTRWRLVLPVPPEHLG